MNDLEREYSPSSRGGGSADPYIARYRRDSAAASAQLGVAVRDVGGGTLFAAAGPAAPLFVFVHGGYWQSLSAAESLFLAPALQSRGWAYAAVEYTLAPRATIAEMVHECSAALAALALAAPHASCVVLAGHSAGAHLAAMAALMMPSPLPIDRLVLVSGVYDLRRLVRTTVNRPLGLDEASAAVVSPLLLPVVGTVGETVVAWAENDTDTFAAQSRAFSARNGATTILVPGRHHFDILDDLVDPTTSLGAATLAPVRR